MMRLIESAARPPMRAGWTLGSAFAHGSIIGATIVMTMRLPAPEPLPPPPVIRLVYPGQRLVEPAAPAGGGSAQGTGFARPVLPRFDLPPTTSLYHGDPVRVPIAPDPGAPGLGRGGVLGDLVGRGASAGAVHDVSQVDRAVAPFAGNPRPDYPASLRAASLEGDVLVQFVVDTSGFVERGSIVVLSATHPLFGDAVTRWLPRTRYVPAEYAGGRVRQLVQQRVAFALTR